MSILALAAMILAVPLGHTVTSPAPGQACEKIDESTEEVIHGLTLAFDSSFLCPNAPTAGTYELTVRVTSRQRSVEAVTIEDVELANSTPRPLGASPDATGEAGGLPVILAPGHGTSFVVRGTYALAKTDEGEKANLHFRVLGAGAASGEPFAFGINAHLRAPGAEEGSADSTEGRWGGRPRASLLRGGVRAGGVCLRQARGG